MFDRAVRIIRRLPLPGEAEASALLTQNERLAACDCPIFGRARSDCPAENNYKEKTA